MEFTSASKSVSCHGPDRSVSRQADKLDRKLLITMISCSGAFITIVTTVVFVQFLENRRGEEEAWARREQVS